MARLDRATHPARVYAPIESHTRLDGPLFAGHDMMVAILLNPKPV